jgi:hypothetical protein
MAVSKSSSSFGTGSALRKGSVMVRRTWIIWSGTSKPGSAMVTSFRFL